MKINSMRKVGQLGKVGQMVALNVNMYLCQNFESDLPNNKNTICIHVV